MYKQNLPVALLLSTLFIVPMHAWCGEEAHTASKRASENPAKEELLKIEREWTIAEDKHDADALRRILDEHFVVTSGTRAPPYGKERFIKQMLAGEVDPTASQTLSDPTVVIDGDTAVVVATDTTRGTINGQAYTTVFRYTTTYIHRHGRWVALAEHIVRVP